MVRRLIILMVPLFIITSCSSNRHIALAQDQHMDPVCGAIVSEQNARNYTFLGKEYYFDSQECQTVFKNNPEKFQNTQQKRSSANGMHMGWAPISGIVMVLGMTAAMIIGVSH